MKYKKRLQQSPEELQAKSIDKTVALAKLQAQADLLETQSALAEAELTLEALKNSNQLSIVVIAEQQDNVNALVKGITAIEELIKELF